MSKRVFRLKMSHQEGEKCEHCCELGLYSSFSRQREDLLRSIKKCDYELIDEVWLPCWAHKDDHYEEIISELKKKSKRVRQVSHDIKDSDDQKIYVTTNVTQGDLAAANQTSHKDTLYIVTKNNARAILNGKNTGRSNLYFYFPMKLKWSDHYLSCRAVNKMLVQGDKKGLALRPYPGLSVIEKRGPEDIHYEYLAAQNSGDDEGEIKTSIIIPMYNQKKYLLRTLAHICKQDYDMSELEVVIVDDGSPEKMLESDFEHLKNIININYIYFPREVKRTMGDFRFRAGIARNLGFRHSRGQHLLFLDADVLLPNRALTTLEAEAKDADLVQLKRYDLTKSASSKEEPLVMMDKSKDLIYEGRSYWYDFFASEENWNDRIDSWKYVCTYGLFMSRECFSALGGFYNNYIGYGFEDTDLGYRLKQKGGTFLLSTVEAFHQYHGDERSEFANSSIRRRKVLSRTAKTFFLNHLSRDIYRTLRDYM